MHEADYLKKKRDYYFTLKPVRIYVSESYLHFFADSPPAPAQWARLMSSLDACR